jgi:hypothetical protein
VKPVDLGNVVFGASPLAQRGDAIIDAHPRFIVLAREGFGRRAPLRSVRIKMLDAISAVIWNGRNAAIQRHVWGPLSVERLRAGYKRCLWSVAPYESRGALTR